MVVLDIQRSVMGGALLISSLYMKWDIGRCLVYMGWMATKEEQRCANVGSS